MRCLEEVTAGTGRAVAVAGLVVITVLTLGACTETDGALDGGGLGGGDAATPDARVVGDGGLHRDTSTEDAGHRDAAASADGSVRRDAAIEGSEDTDGDGFPGAEDCDDGDPDVYPGADELCNGSDDDCDDEVDEDPVDLQTFIVDADGDGYGAEDGETRMACDAPEGFAAMGGDCDDGDTAFHPGATEDDCTDPADYNCDGSVAFADNDGDGFAACEECDDGDPDRNPAATEACNGVGDDCDADTPDGMDEPWFGTACDGSDADLCQEGTLVCGAGVQACSDATGDSAEVCNDMDDDCDGSVDEGVGDIRYEDDDDDGFGNPDVFERFCEPVSGYVDDSSDCDDSDDEVNPRAADLCDGIDNDCSVETADGDDEPWLGRGCDGSDEDMCMEGTYVCVEGARMCSDETGDAAEICNDRDDDCDGDIDEDLDGDPVLGDGEDLPDEWDGPIIAAYPDIAVASFEGRIASGGDADWFAVQATEDLIDVCTDDPGDEPIKGTATVTAPAGVALELCACWSSDEVECELSERVCVNVPAGSSRSVETRMAMTCGAPDVGLLDMSVTGRGGTSCEPYTLDFRIRE